MSFHSVQRKKIKSSMSFHPFQQEEMKTNFNKTKSW